MIVIYCINYEIFCTLSQNLHVSLQKMTLLLIIPLTFYHCVYHCESSEEKHFFTLDLLFSHTDPTQEPEPLNQGL